MTTDTTTVHDRDIGHPRNIHVVGVGGAGMSAIALVLVGRGHTVTGSDLSDSKVVARLRSAGVEVTVGHDAANLGNADLVTHSTAIPDSNPESVAGRERGLPVLRRAEILASSPRCGAPWPWPGPTARPPHRPC